MKLGKYCLKFNKYYKKTLVKSLNRKLNKQKSAPKNGKTKCKRQSNLICVMRKIFLDDDK